jgi:hypothetical protein
MIRTDDGIQSTVDDEHGTVDEPKEFEIGEHVLAS